MQISDQLSVTDVTVAGRERPDIWPSKASKLSPLVLEDRNGSVNGDEARKMQLSFCVSRLAPCAIRLTCPQRLNVSMLQLDFVLKSSRTLQNAMASIDERFAEGLEEA